MINVISFSQLLFSEHYVSYYKERIIGECLFQFLSGYFSDEMCKEKQFNLGEPSSEPMNYVKCEFDGKRLKLSDQARPNDDE